MTPLDKTLKCSLSIKGIEYVVTLSPDETTAMNQSLRP